MLFLLSAHAFTLLESDWFWEADPIEAPFVLDAASFPPGFAEPEAFEAAVIEALRIWNSHPDARFTARYGGLASEVSGPVIPIRYEANSGGSQIGLAPQTFFPAVGDARGETTESAVVIYGANQDGPVSWYVGADLEGLTSLQNDFVSTLTHEIGHVAGLDHSGIPAAFMSPSRVQGTGFRALHIDDETGLETLYGAGSISFEATVEGQDDPSIGATDTVAHIRLRNVGNKLSVLPRVAVVGGPGFLVNAEASTPDTDLEPGGEVVFEMPITVEGCQSATFDVRLEITDRNGSQQLAETLIDIECPVPEPPPEEEEKGGCTTAVLRLGWLTRR